MRGIGNSSVSGVESVTGLSIANCGVGGEFNAQRIVACINACEGMTDEMVSHGLVSASVFSSVVNERDELRAALARTK